MAIRYAVQNGNWSDPLTWDGQTTIPTSSDDVYSNAFTVTVDISPTVLTVRNSSATSITAGGWFELSNGITLTATVGASSGASGAGVIRFSLSSPNSATFIGNVSPGNVTLSNNIAISNVSSGTLNITGNITGGFALQSGCHGVSNTSSGTINITGAVTGGGSNNGTNYGVFNSLAGTINITGSVTGGSGGGGSTNHGVFNNFSGFVIITGSSTGGTNGTGVVNNSTGNITITGTLNGTNSGINAGLLNSSSGIINHLGTVQASSTAPGMGVGSVSQQTFLTGPFIGHPNGLQANIAAAWRWNLSAVATYMEVYSIDPNNLIVDYKRALYTADSVGGNPAVADTRSGVVFGPVGELTGTMVVPDPSTVRRGVPVDDTFGTAAITAEELWEYPVSSMTTPGSIGARLRQALTTPLLGKYLEAYGTYEGSEVPPAP